MSQFRTSDEPKAFNMLDRINDRVATVLFYVAGLSLVIAVLALVFSVIMRYGFRAPWDWSLDLPRFLQVAIVALALMMAQRLRGHITVDILPNRLFSGWSGKMTEVLKLLVTLFFCGILAWGSTQEAISAFKVGEKAPDTGIPYGVIYLLILAGLVLLALEVLLGSWHSFLKKRPDERGQ